MTAKDYHRLTPSVSVEQLIPIVEEEARTHVHLTPGEILRAGDIYGGRDWKFVFEIGSSSVQSPKPGDPCPISAYRYRRPKAIVPILHSMHVEMDRRGFRNV